MRTSQLPRLCAALAANVNRGSVGRDALRARPGVLGGRASGLAAGFDPRQRGPRPSRAAPRAAAAQPRGPRVERLRGGRRTAVRRVQSVFERITETSPAHRCAPNLPRRSASTPGGARRSPSPAMPWSVFWVSSPSRRPAAFEIRGRVAVGELRIDAIAPSPPRPLRYAPPPASRRSSRIWRSPCPDDRLAGDALDAIQRALASRCSSAPSSTTSIEAAASPPGRKGWTFRLTFRAPDRTLTGDEAQRAQDAIATALTLAMRRGDSHGSRASARVVRAADDARSPDDLIGCALVVDAGRPDAVVARIVETEAYLGTERPRLPRVPRSDASVPSHVRPGRRTSTCTSPTACTTAPTWSPSADGVAGAVLLRAACGGGGRSRR